MKMIIILLDLDYEDENDNYPFRFGLRKAQLILDNIDEIKKFVKEKTK
jgi:hypothetical protein